MGDPGGGGGFGGEPGGFHGGAGNWIDNTSISTTSTKKRRWGQQ